MGKIIARHLKCLSDECGSSDARSVYEDGTSFCFSCQSWFPKQDGEDLSEMTSQPKATSKAAPNFFKKILTVDEIKEYPIRGFRDRQITKEITEFFGVHVSYNDSGEVDTHYTRMTTVMHIKLESYLKTLLGSISLLAYLVKKSLMVLEND